MNIEVEILVPVGESVEGGCVEGRAGQGSNERVEVKLAGSGKRVGQVIGGVSVAVGDILGLAATLQRRGSKNGVANNILLVAAVAASYPNTCSGRDDSVVKNPYQLRVAAFVWLESGRIPIGTDKKVVVQRHITRPLKKRFLSRVLIKEIAVDEVNVVAAHTG